MTNDTITGRSAVRLIEGIKTSLDAAGAGEYRAIKFLGVLTSLGLDVVAADATPEALPASAAETFPTD